MKYYIYTGKNNFELITGEQLSEEYKTINNLTEEIFDAPEDSVTIAKNAEGNWYSLNQADVIAKVNAGELP